MRPITHSLLGIALTAVLGMSTSHAQITPPREITEPGVRTATLEEQLTNRLRAVREEQREYIRLIVRQVERKKLEVRLVFAVERYAIRRNPQYPFPFFERAIRYEAAKRGVSLPTVVQYTSTRNPVTRTNR